MKFRRGNQSAQPSSGTPAASSSKSPFGGRTRLSGGNPVLSSTDTNLINLLKSDHYEAYLSLMYAQPCGLFLPWVEASKKERQDDIRDKLLGKARLSASPEPINAGRYFFEEDLLFRIDLQGYTTALPAKIYKRERSLLQDIETPIETYKRFAVQNNCQDRKQSKVYLQIYCPEREPRTLARLADAFEEAIQAGVTEVVLVDGRLLLDRAITEPQRLTDLLDQIHKALSDAGNTPKKKLKAKQVAGILDTIDFTVQNTNAANREPRNTFASSC